MKNFLTSACVKIGRFFWSWGFLKFILWTVTVIIFLYVEEDWRGARAWAATKAEWEAQGETFDINRLAPPPAPDEQNLAALPLFKMEPDPDLENKGNLAPLALNRAFKVEIDQEMPHGENWQAEELPRGGNWQAGKLADHEKNRVIVATTYAKVFKSAHTTMDPLTQFEALYAAIGDLRNAAAARPYCRFEQNYKFEPPYGLYLSLITAQIKLSKFLTADAVLGLDAKKPDVALADITTHFKLVSGVMDQPLLVSGLVAIGMTAIDFSAVYEGLTTHAWNDAQLAELQDRLASVDFLTDYQHAMRGEACLTIAPFEQLKPNRGRLISELHPQAETNPPTPPERQDYTPLFWPDGWIDLLKARAANFGLTSVHFADEKKRVFSPAEVDRFTAEVEDTMERWGNPFSPWAILSGAAVGPVTQAARKFALAQAWIDEARIACALERYRLAKGIYPGSLDALTPAYIDALPHDIMNGQPYHYRLRPDGTFLLYSVGWNQIDEGGKIVFKKDNPNAIDYTEGDWVWPTPR